MARAHQGSTWGARPERVDLVLDTARMDTVVEHAAGDLIVVEAVGARQAARRPQADLVGSGQWLAVDPLVGARSAAWSPPATTGPTRLLHGPVRDLVIGMTMVRADGVVAHSGGKVVKNVAGYDMSAKLLTGSFGTLGVVTQAAFRLHPLPEARGGVSVLRPRWQPHTPRRHTGARATGRALPIGPTAVEVGPPATGVATLCLLLEEDSTRCGSPSSRPEGASSLWAPAPPPGDDPPRTDGARSLWWVVRCCSNFTPGESPRLAHLLHCDSGRRLRSNRDHCTSARKRCRGRGHGRPSWRG